MNTTASTAARHLAQGDPLGCLRLVALGKDATSLALRGIAMAQLGEFARARFLLRKAARLFGKYDIVARTRCEVAEAEVALVSRDLGSPVTRIREARQALADAGDALNAAFAGHLEVRRLLLTGHLSTAEELLGDLGPSASPVVNTIRELAYSQIALRRLDVSSARQAGGRAKRAARKSRVPALLAEVNTHQAALGDSAARLRGHGFA